MAQQRRLAAQSCKALAPEHPLVGVIWHLPGRPLCYVKYVRGPLLLSALKTRVIGRIPLALYFAAINLCKHE